MVEEIKGKLQLLKILDADLEIFGSGKHAYELKPPLSLTEFSAIEQKYNCSFPEEYKAFITQVGNGGAGPAYGVFSLEMHDDNHDFISWDKGYLIGDLSQRFPYKKRWNLTDHFWETMPQHSDDLSDEENENLYFTWEQKLDKYYWNNEVMRGAIPICHLGCALRIWLVVTGPEKGNIWQDYRVDRKGVFPMRDRDKFRYTFFDWYLKWLEDSLSEIKK